MSIGEISSTPVTRFLDECGVSYRFFRHPGAVHSLEQAARERGQRPEQIIRSIVFRLSRGGFVMVLVAGEKQVSWQALRHHLGTSRISMATEDGGAAGHRLPIGSSLTVWNQTTIAHPGRSGCFSGE